MRVTYNQLVDELINVSRQDAVAVRRVLLAMASVLNILPEGAMVQTPMGTFKVVRVAGQRIHTPSGQTGMSSDLLIVRLKAGKRMRRTIPS